MIRRLAQIRLSRLQIGLVAAASAAATALVIANATPGRTPAEAAVLAALHRPGVIVHHLGGSSPGEPVGNGGDPGATPVGGNPSPVPGATPPAPATAPAATAGSASTQSAATPGSSSPASSPPPSKTYKVKHVFVIALSTTTYSAAFGPGSPARYLNHSLVPKGALLTGYRSLGASELSDYIAMISGQAPNADTAAGCPTYADFPGTAKPDARGEVSGAGCVYPDTVLTVGDQVTGSGKVWKAYLDGLDTTACVHPDANAQDDALLPGAGSNYDTRHNPFIYFHSLLDLGDCAADDGGLTQLPADLASTGKTPTYAFIAPGSCEDSDQTACANGGLAGEDGFLRQSVPKILQSKAYKRGGALMIVFTSSRPDPGTPEPTTGSSGPTGTTGPSSEVGAPGSGHPTRAGALVISPYTTAGTKVAGGLDPYSVLRSVDELLGYPALAHAAQARSFVAAALPHA